MSVEFEKLLARHRQLSGELQDARGFMEYLQGELESVEKEMRELVSELQSRPLFSSNPTIFPPVVTVSLPPTATAERKASNALRETAEAVARLGDGVDAARLAEHLNVSREAARLRLQRAASRGLISRMANGRYRTLKRRPQPESEIKPEAKEEATLKNKE